MFTSIEQKLTEILEENPSGVLKGHIASLDKRDIVHHSRSSSVSLFQSEMRTYVTSFSLETEEGTIFVKLNRKATLTLRIGTEVWVAGTRVSDDRFEADMIVIPELQQVLDSSKQAIEKRLMPLLIPAMIFLVGLAYMLSGDFGQIMIGMGLVLMSFFLGCGAICCILQSSGAKPKSTKYETWEFIKSRFI